jgi:hypothetical protein
MRYVLVVAGLLWFVAAGCGAAQLRTDESSAAIRAAEEVGAAGVPRAALHLQLARESLAKAVKLQAQGDAAQARSLLTRAEADAELAVVLSQEEAEKQEAAKAVERVRQLQLANPERSLP